MTYYEANALCAFLMAMGITSFIIHYIYINGGRWMNSWHEWRRRRAIKRREKADAKKGLKHKPVRLAIRKPK